VCFVCLQKKVDKLKALDDKSQQLKRQNADLAARAYKFEEKLKQHQHGSVKV